MITVRVSSGVRAGVIYCEVFIMALLFIYYLPSNYYLPYGIHRFSMGVPKTRPLYATPTPLFFLH